MPKYYTSLQKATHFTNLYLTDSPEISYFDQMLQSFQQRDQQIRGDEDKSFAIGEIVNKLESIRDGIRSNAQSRFYNDNNTAYKGINEVADNIRDFEQMYNDYLQSYPEEQDDPSFEQFRDLWSRPADQGQEVLDSHDPSKTATQWIDEAKAELKDNTYEPDRYLARIIAARQLANAQRGRRANIDNTQITEGQLESRTRQLLEDRTFRAFLKANALPNYLVDPLVQEAAADDAMIQEENAKNRYISLLDQGHGGAFEDKLDEFVKQQADHQNLDQALYGRYQEPLYYGRGCTQNMQPVSEGTPAGQREYTEDDLALLVLRTNTLEYELGISPREDGHYDKMPDGTPRIFTIHEDSTGTKRMMSLEEAGIERNSVEFFKEIQKGNMFVYPAGDSRPVQLQLNSRAGDLIQNTELKYSKPLSAEQLCPYPEPVRPGFFTRLFSKISSGAKARMDAYNEAKAKRDEFLADAKKIEKDRPKTGIDERRMTGEKRMQEAKDKALKSAQEAVDHLSLGDVKFKSIYGVNPQMREDMLTTNMYDADSFAALRPVDIDLSNVKIGGQEVTEDEFCSLAMGISRLPGYADKNFLHNNPQLAGTIENNIQKMGYSAEDAKKILCGAAATNHSIDFFLSHSRANLDKTFEHAVQPARETAADVLKKYQAGDKAPLAKHLAASISDITRDAAIHLMDPDKSEYMRFMNAAGKLGEMLERDPQLKSMAMKDYGLKESELKTLKGMAKISQLDEEAKKAAVKLAEADKNGTTLGTEEKTECLKTILKSRIANATINHQKDEYEKTDNRYINEILRAPQFMSGAEAGIFQPGVQSLLKNVPVAIGQMSSAKTDDTLGQIADTIIEDNQLFLQPEGQLLNTLKSREYTAKPLALKGAQVMEQIQNEAAPQIQENEAQNDLEEMPVRDNQPKEEPQGPQFG
ncbi:MAG: hypothetical protein J5589_00405 [Firmicutes bacterium]|nr:hypothetical protein [Bacillota bacterium]